MEDKGTATLMMHGANKCTVLRIAGDTWPLKISSPTLDVTVFLPSAVCRAVADAFNDAMDAHRQALADGPDMFDVEGEA